jgi:hypothetical protein
MSLRLPAGPNSSATKLIERPDFMTDLLEACKQQGTEVDSAENGATEAYLIEHNKYWISLTVLEDGYFHLHTGIYVDRMRSAPTAEGFITPTGSKLGNSKFIMDVIFGIPQVEQTIEDIRRYVRNCLDEGKHTAVGWDLESTSGLVIWEGDLWISIKNRRDGSIAIKSEDITAERPKDPVTKKTVQHQATLINPQNLKVKFRIRQILSLIEGIEDVEIGELFRIFKPQ